MISYRFRLLLLLTGILLFSYVIPALGQTVDTTSHRVAVDQLPVTFEQNRGQADSQTRFLARTGAMYLEMRPSEIDVSVGAGQTHDTLKLEFAGSNRKASITPLERAETETNYFPGNDSSQWHTHVPNFKRVRYGSIYPGVDLVFYGNAARVEHDFIVAPFANYHRIQMRVRGAHGVSVERDGSLEVSTSTGKLIFHCPVVYQESARGREIRNGRFTLMRRNGFRFEIGDYDRAKPLIIDPVLTYETYLATTPLTTFGVAADSAGNTYVSGVAETNGSIGPLVVLKVNPAGTGLAYVSYFGNSQTAGSSLQPRGGIAVDSNGDVIVAVWSFTTNLPLKNPAVPAPTGSFPECEYVLSLAPDGSSINYASLLGGSFTYVAGLAVDVVGNAYVTGTTNTTSYPVTAGALNNGGTQSSSLNIVYITKFLADGSLGYSALIGNAQSQMGGSGLEGSSAITTDVAGNAYITGAAGALWPVTGNAYQTTIPGTFPTTAPFVTKLSADGSTILYSTFLGTVAQPAGIAVNAGGQALVAGWDAQATFPTTGNAYQTTIPTLAVESFLSELSADGSQLVYSTFVGGKNPTGSFIDVNAMSVDLSGDVWLAGITNSYNLPMVQPLQPVPATGLANPGFLVRFDSNLSTLTFETFVGDLTGGIPNISIAADANGRLHMAGGTGYEMYTTPNAYTGMVAAPPANNFYIYGFSAVVDPSVPAPAVCFPTSSTNSNISSSNLPAANNLGVSFPRVLVNTTSFVGLVVTNCGQLPLQIAGTQSSDPAYTVPVGSSALNIETPDFPGRTIAIEGLLIVCLLPLLLSIQTRWRSRSVFGFLLLFALLLGCSKDSGTNQTASGASAPSSSKSPPSTCQQPVPVNGSCTLEVTFAPTAQKSYPAQLTITSNAPMPIILPMNGAGQ